MMKLASWGEKFRYWRYHTFGDEEWLRVLLDSIEGKARVPMPSFPPDELQATFVGMSNEMAIRDGWNFYMFMADRRSKCGLVLDHRTHVLDFGCGWGRLARLFLRDVPAANIWCADSYPLALELCRDTGVPGHLVQLQQMPPSQLPTEQFDLAFAYSVFSHLSPTAHLAWRDEFARVLKPGALVFVTTQARWFLDQCQYMRDNPAARTHPWHELLAKSFVDHEESLARFDRGELLYSPTGSGPSFAPEFYGEAIVPRAFFESQWCTRFEVLEYIADRSRCEQAVVVMRKR